MRTGPIESYSVDNVVSNYIPCSYQHPQTRIHVVDNVIEYLVVPAVVHFDCKTRGRAESYRPIIALPNQIVIELCIVTCKHYAMHCSIVQNVVADDGI